MTAVVAAGMAGCGGGSHHDANGLLSRSDLADRADSICRRGGDQLLAAGRVDPSDPVKARAYFRKVAALSRRQAAGLRALRPDAGARADFAALVRSSTEGARLLTQLADAAATGDSDTAARLVARMPAIVAAGDRAAKRIGADDCASDTAPQGF